MNPRYSRRRIGLFLMAMACSASMGLHAQPEKGNEPVEKIRLSINPGQLSYLPLFWAIDKGYFREAGIDLAVTTYKGSANTQIPLLARGDVDISTAVAGPGMFNQAAGGFHIKLIGSLSEPRQGYKDSVVLMVRKDVADAGLVKTPADLKGKKIDGSALGNPIDFLMKQTLVQSGLKASDAHVSYRTRSPADFEQLMKQRVAEVAGVSEPTATQVEAAGLAVKWKSYIDVIPWYQETFLSASEAVVKNRPQAVSRFLTGYLRAVQDIAKTNGRWTPELQQTATKWTGISADILEKMGGLPYWDPSAAIKADSLKRVQQFWVGEGLVKEPIRIETLIDDNALSAAQKALNRK
jgi:NitT/TauT family transport system substrate-binding protein